MPEMNILMNRNVYVRSELWRRSGWTKMNGESMCNVGIYNWILICSPVV